MGFIVLKFFNLLYVTILLSLLVYKFTTSLFGFSILFLRLADKDSFIIQPLSPDNCAGLKILSNFSIFFMYMVLPFFLIFISINLRGSDLLIGQQVAMLGLIIFLVITFFLPLGSIHSAMRRTKQKELDYYSYHFLIHNNSIKKHIDNNKINKDFITDVEALEKLDFIYRKVLKMPVWPFDFGSLWRFVTALLFPFTIFVLDQTTNENSIFKRITEIY